MQFVIPSSSNSFLLAQPLLYRMHFARQSLLFMVCSSGPFFTRCIPAIPSACPALILPFYPPPSGLSHMLHRPSQIFCMCYQTLNLQPPFHWPTSSRGPRGPGSSRRPAVSKQPGTHSLTPSVVLEAIFWGMRLRASV